MNKKFLDIAINLAKKNLGKTAPNPSVGCVIVKNDKIISYGATAINGRPHAEQIAIDKIQDKSELSNATLYVSLEPCCHQGQTPPCTQKIIDSGIKTVIIAATDPDPRVSGKGIEALQKHGINVKITENDRAKSINRGFFKAKNTNKPFCTLKIATSINHKIARKNKEDRQISNQNSQRFVHVLRSLNDGILIGANTLKSDNPVLNCRINGLENFSPKRFILSKKLDFDSEFKIFNDQAPTFIVTSEKNKNKDLQEFTKKSVKIIFCQEKNNEIDLEDALEKICEQDINSLLIEGGQNLTTKFLKQNLVDEFILIQNNKPIEDGIDAVSSSEYQNFDEALKNLEIQAKKPSGIDDIIKIYQKL